MPLGAARAAITRPKAGTPTWQQVIDLATTDGWLAVYDPTNPNTRTLRDDSGTLFFEELVDGLGNLPSLLQATEANQPALTAGGFDQLDAMLFNGTSSFLRRDFGLDAVAQPDFVLVLIRNDAATLTADHHILDGFSSSPRQQMRTWSSGEYTIFAGSEFAGPASDNDPHSIGGLYNGSSSEIWYDAVLEASGNAGTLAMGGLTVGSWEGPSSGNRWDGLVGAILIFEGTPSSTVRENMFNLLHDLSGIPLGS